MLHVWLLSIALGVTLRLASAGNCCCGIQCMVKCPTPPVCPRPPPCSPPAPSIAVVCSTKQCPPPPPCPSGCPASETCDPCPECPPPPPPPTCPECPPPNSAPCPPPTQCPPQQPCQVSTTTTTIQTDCCEGCTDSSGCSARYKGRKFVARSRSRSRMHRNARAKRELDDHDAIIEVNPLCNSEILMKIMVSNISKSVEESKRSIQKNAEAAMKQKFNVICSNGAFSYVAHTNTFCQASANGVHCYAFSF